MGLKLFEEDFYNLFDKVLSGRDSDNLMNNSNKELDFKRISMDDLEDMHATQKDIKKLFMSNPNLHEVNWFRNDEYKAAQIARKIY